MSQLSNSQKLKNVYPTDTTFYFGKSGCMAAYVVHGPNSDCQDIDKDFRLDDVLTLLRTIDYDMDGYCPCVERNDLCELLSSIGGLNLDDPYAVTAPLEVIYRGLKCFDDFRRDPTLEWRHDHHYWGTLPAFESSFLDYFVPFLEKHKACGASLRIRRFWGF